MKKIHKYEQNGLYIVIDIASSSVHSFDELGFSLLDFIDEDAVTESVPAAAMKALSGKYPPDDIMDCYAEIYALYKEGVLFSEDNYKSIAAGIFRGEPPIKALCLHIAHDCNLRCEYCFAAKGDFGKGRMFMPFEVAKAAIDLLIARSGKRRNLEVDFFGGEPLMNFPVVKETVLYARSLENTHDKNFRFTLTTNGLLLNDENIDFINKEMSNVVLSIDGRPEVNDKLRVTASGKGSYHAILPKYKKLLERRGYENYYVRGTFTTLNPDFTEDVMHLYNEGFDQISVEPVVSDEALDYSIKKRDLPRVFDEYNRLATEILRLKLNESAPHINFFHFMLDLDGGPCAIKRLRGCGCGGEYIAVTPEGEIYPCHQFVGMDEWKLGTITGENAGGINRDIVNKFQNAHIYTKSGCEDCWCRYYCSGGCNANNVQYEGDLLTPHNIGCELERKRVECAVMIKVALAESE